MTITLTTPAFLFPAVTFLLIAYTNRFLALGNRIRLLHDRYLETSNDSFIDQFRGENPETNSLKVKKDGGEIDALTGATITSRAFGEATQMAYEEFIKNGALRARFLGKVFG